ncbi:hypothetical protein PHYPO_G00031130 [Pangasianodon hypophthalmus]|uniref:Uncharacterized protein n=1 Tax=Pangasianodon hypophthalmus TaxID=310915 RepID=A0A5N5MJN7_PANHP|nr:hypothetical protein PHYPO_G00031130 [Pangasianodon hypophthalmus]
MVNAGKRRYSTSSDTPNKNIKRPRKGEVNYLSDLPDRQNASILEISRQQLVDEMKKKTPSAVVINRKMDLTLSLQRKDVVIDKPPVSQILQHWPALFVKVRCTKNSVEWLGRTLNKNSMVS